MLAGPAFALRAVKTAALDLGQFLPYRLSVLANKVSRQLAAVYAARFGITIPQWRVVAVLGQDSDVSADFVCGRTEMDRVTVSRAVAALQEQGLVLRRTSPEDRRCSMLRLSAAGRRLYADVVPLARAYEAELLRGLAPADRAALDRVLAALQARVDAGSGG